METQAWKQKQNKNEKALERHKHSAPVRRSQKFSPRRRPPSQVRGTAKI